MRRLFSYNNTWANKDIEFYRNTDGKGETFYEAYPENSERYPIVIVTPTGGNFESTGFNDLVREVDDDTVDLGERRLELATISNTQIVKTKLPSLDGVAIRGISIDSAWNGEGVGGDDIDFKLYKDYTTSPVLIASGSIPGHTEKSFITTYREFTNNIILTASPYHLVLSSTGDSPYFIAIDNTVDNTYLYSNSVPVSGSVVGKVVLPAFLRIGGNYRGGLSLRVSSKNDSKTAYSLSELISTYFHLLKHAEISRKTGNIDGTKLDQTEQGVISEFLSKGIFIDTVRMSGLETRKRSDQEVIYSITVSVDILTEWFEDYPADSIKDITALIKTFTSGTFQGETLEVTVS